MMRRVVAIIAVVAGVALGGPVHATVFDCRLAANSPTGGMPPQIIIDYSANTASAVVSHGWDDGPVTHQAPVNARANGFALTVTNSAQINGRMAVLHYRMTYRTDRNSMNVLVQVGAGFEGHLRGTYGCTVR